MSQDAELDRLLVAYLGDDLDAIGMAELERRLVSDPAASARLAWWCRQDLSLRSFAPVSSATRSLRRPRARVALLPWVIAAAAVLAFAVTWWSGELRPTTPTGPANVLAVVQTCSATAWAQRAGKRLPLAAGQPLSAHDVLTCVGGPLTIRYPDDTTVELGDDSVAVLGDAAEGKRLRLERGRLQAAVTRQPPARPLRLRTPHAEAVVRGTRLTLALSGGGTRLEVSEGAVELMQGERTVMVRTGEFAIAKPGEELAARPLPTNPQPAAPSGHTEDPVIAFDFEDGQRPAFLQDGDVVAGPPRPGNRFCVAGIPKPAGDQIKKEVWFGQPHIPIFTYEKGMEVRFDCWFTSASGTFSTCFWDVEQERTMSLVVPGIEPGRWARVVLRLDDFYLETDPSSRVQTGDRVLNLLFAVFGSADDVIYVDNVAITRRPASSE